VILFSLVNDGLLRVSASGGPSAAFASPDRSKDERFLAWPRFLPDGQHFLYLVDSPRPEIRGIYVGRLGSTMRKRVLGAFSSAAFAQDHLLWSEGGTVLAQRFDLSNLELMADPFPVAQQVAHNIGTGRAVFSLSQTGVLAYRSVPETQLTWFDRAGSPQGTIGSPGIHFSFSLSPRLSAIAADRVDQETGRSDVWVIDAESGGERRLTFDSALDFMPLWSADGARIVFVSTRNGAWDLFEKSSTGEGGDRLLVHSSAAKRPVGWMLDRRTLIFSADDPQAGPSLWWLPDDGGRPRPISQGERTLAQAQLSPDGRYLAGVGDADALIVQSFPTLDDRWQISPPSGIYPRWRSDGRELFYITRDLSMMSVSVSYAPRFRAGPPTELFKVRTLSPSGLVGRSYDVTPDGQRFLVKVPTRPAPITVVVNWLQR
jgi:hypothetical protein